MTKNNLHPQRALRSVLLVLLLSAVGMTNAEDIEDINFNEGRFHYYVIEPMVSVGISFVTDWYGTLIIPETVTHNGITYSVVSLGGFGGSNHLIGNIVIPNSVTEIRDYAFANCPNLSGELTIPSSVTYIGKDAFNGTGFSTVNFNARECTYMGYYYNSGYGYRSAFSDCPNLTTLNIGEGVQYIPENAFNGCNTLAGELTIPASVNHIGSNAFSYTGFSTVNFNATECTDMGYSSPFSGCSNLTTLNIGEGVQIIPYGAFRGCNTLTGELTIPASVIFIGQKSFSQTGFSTVNLNATELTYFDHEYYYYEDAPFSGCSNLTTLNIGEGVQYIPEDFFIGCSTLTGELTIPASVTFIGQRAFSYTGFSTVNFNATELTYFDHEYYYYEDAPFSGCSNLTTLNIGEGVQYIPENTFNRCSTLTGELTIPASVTYIGYGAFSYTGFSTVNFNATECTYTNMGEEVYYDVSPFYGCPNLTTLNIGEDVQYIPDNTFNGCNTLTGELAIPASVKYIGNYAFSGCLGFTGSLVIPNAVTFIGYGAFSGCNGFDGTLSLGNSLQSIGDYAFQYCNNFTGELTIPNSVENIGFGAFYSNAFTGVLTIGTGVTSLGARAFANTGFSDVHYNATSCLDNEYEYDGENYEYGSFFHNCPNLTTLVVGNNVQNIPEVAFYNCSTFTGTLVLPNSLISIGEGAFYNCYGLEGVVMGESVETIGREAFRNCGGLRGELTLPETLLSVGPSAFAGCNEISTLNYNAVNCGTMGNASQNVFADCLSLAHIRIGANVESIPNYAFKPCFLVTGMSVAAEVPPTIYASTFGTVSRNIPVSVPVGSGEAYRTAPYWEGFFHITEDYSPNSYTYHWDVNIHQYETNMTVTGIIQIEGVEQAVPYFEIGAFCNGECRGRQLLTYYPQVDRYLVFLMLYGEASDMFNFRLYNHETNEESIPCCASIVTFEPNAIMGTFEGPFVFNFTSVQNTFLSQGWNWYSSYVELGSGSHEMMTASLGENGLLVKSQTDGFVSYDDGEWFGTLSAVYNEDTYLINTSANCIMSVSGDFVTPTQHPITMANGWNWIGYPSTSAVDLNTALGAFTPHNGDMIKNQDNFSIYADGMGWIGDFNTIYPGMGLMYNSLSSQPVTFVYSNGAKSLHQNRSSQNNHWVSNRQNYPYNMSVMAVVCLDGEELNDSDIELAAFDDVECRGSARLLYVEPLNRYIAFMTVSGDDSVDLTWKLYDSATGMEYENAECHFGFEQNGIIGSIDHPYVVNFSTMIEMEEPLVQRLTLYPNPVKANGMTEIDIPYTSKAHVEVVNPMGVVVSVETVTGASASIKVPVVSGVYVVKVVIEGMGTYASKLIVE